MFTGLEFQLLMQLLEKAGTDIKNQLDNGIDDREKRDDLRHKFIRIGQIMRKVQAIQGTATETTLAQISDHIDLNAMFENMKAISAAQQEKGV